MTKFSLIALATIAVWTGATSLRDFVQIQAQTPVFELSNPADGEE